MAGSGRVRSQQLQRRLFLPCCRSTERARLSSGPAVLVLCTRTCRCMHMHTRACSETSWRTPVECVEWRREEDPV